MKKINVSIALVITALMFAGCDLEQNPVSETNKEAVFSSEAGLSLYANSFYNWMPNQDNITRADAIADFTARRNVPDFLRPGTYTSRVSDNTSASAYDLVALGGDWNWGWGALRNINFFLVNNTDPSVPEATRKHYNGLARFFRAWFYFEKVKRYGDVPWINKPLDVADQEELYGPRDPRAAVMDSILADLNYAIANMNPKDDASRTTVTRDVAIALKSRIALFEGTFRKYHPEVGLQSTAATWLNEAATAASQLMTSGKYSLNTSGGADAAYRQLFVSDAPVSREVLLSVVSSTPLGVRHSSNWWYTSATTGIRLSFTRPFVNTYLNIDGTPFTSRNGYETMVFADEMEGRDKRLAQTIRTPGYKRTNAGKTVAAPPAFSYTYTGYQPIKWSVDEVGIDGGANNTNAVAVFRYAEVLLNYAEAKAELGTLSAADWTQTIGALRSRAGITGGINALPTTVDTYLQQNFFPDISDPVILEVRRERGIELALEGFRFYDLIRWKHGELMARPWTGMYVPAADQLMDLDKDGTPDVYFQTKAPASKVSGVIYIDVTKDQKLKNGTSGELTWRSDIPMKWEDKLNYYPIPEAHRLTNPNLAQNPGWE